MTELELEMKVLGLSLDCVDAIVLAAKARSNPSLLIKQTDEESSHQFRQLMKRVHQKLFVRFAAQPLDWQIDQISNYIARFPNDSRHVEFLMDNLVPARMLHKDTGRTILEIVERVRRAYSTGVARKPQDAYRVKELKNSSTA